MTVMPGVFTQREDPSNVAPSSFTSFSTKEPTHVLTDLNTGWGISWKKVGGGPSLILDKACTFSTLQLSYTQASKGAKSHTVYALAPFLTALGSNQRVMLAERLTLLVDRSEGYPSSSLMLALAVKVWQLLWALLGFSA